MYIYIYIDIQRGGERSTERLGHKSVTRTKQPGHVRGCEKVMSSGTISPRQLPIGCLCWMGKKRAQSTSETTFVHQN